MSQLDEIVTPEDVDGLFKLMLKRPVGNDELCRNLVSQGVTIRQLTDIIMKSEEMKRNFEDVIVRNERNNLLGIEADEVFDFRYRVPTDLSVNRQPIRRALIIGSCLSELWCEKLDTENFNFEIDLYFVGKIPDRPKHAISEYDFQIVQMPLRQMVPDESFVRLPHDDLGAHENLFAHSLRVMRHLFANSMKWNRTDGLLTFVVPFATPQQNLLGRLFPKNDLRNPAHFIERLNQSLSEEVSGYANTYMIDVNEIMSTYGRKFVSEDMIAQFNHGSFIGDYDTQYDRDRLEAAVPATRMYYTAVSEVISAIWHEIYSMYRTIKGTDAVKMVVIDLDDTLWRGVVAEMAPGDMLTTEGWPKAFWETLLFLKRRGILLAIISKNEESRVREVWDEILEGDLKLDDFVAHKINWLPKSQNMKEILEYVNVLPNSVVYIDDNPAQRAEIKEAFPDIRVMGGTPARWRHVLLFSSETQVSKITDESSKRTDMVRAQIQREEARRELNQEDFLSSLGVSMTCIEITDTSHPRFARAMELINKTNQYNTTGRRWTYDQLYSALSAGYRLVAFDVSDRYTNYGIIGVVVIHEGTIEQFVMSCRVMGMEIENAIVAHAAQTIRGDGGSDVAGVLIETGRNTPCLDVFAKCGFTRDRDGWVLSGRTATSVPKHVEIRRE